MNDMAWLKRIKVIPWDGTSSVDEVVKATVDQFLDSTVRLDSSSHLMRDLKLDSDDLTSIALLLEKSFGLKIPREEYLGVHVFSDLTGIFRRVVSGDTGLATDIQSAERPPGP
jgi:acyl carrier protein